MLALLAACNGDDDTAPSTVPAPTATADVATTLSATTDALATTSAATSTSSTTATPTTGPAATSAPAPTTASTPAPTTAETTEEQLALAVLEAAYDAWRECIRSIATCDTSVFDPFEVDPQLAGDKEQIAQWQELFYEAENVDSLTYEVLELHLGFTIPYVLVCERDQTVLVRRGPGEPEEVVHEYNDVLVREVQLRRLPDGWRVEAIATREAQSCD